VGLPVLDQDRDLDGVVGQHPEPAPGLGALKGVEQGAVEAVAAFEVGDPALAAGAPLDQPAEPSGALDLAAGLAGLARILADRGAKVTGIDTSSALIAAASSHPDARTTDARFYVANVEDIPEPNERFDLGVCNHVMSDVDDPATALKELGRVLRPGGRLVVN
jgi:SAM-dependent methyltransferase